MKKLIEFVNGTVRPICFLAGLLVIVGAYLGKAKMNWDICYAVLAAIFGSGFANSFNNVIDRKIDRLNLNKKTLAVRSPIAAWYVALFLLPGLAFVLRSASYNNWLMAELFYVSFIYSFVFGRMPVLKRIVVGAVVALSVLLHAREFNLELWLFLALVFGYIFTREGRKDRDDREEDSQVRFAWLGKTKYDVWCLTAPFLAAAVYTSCFVLAKHRFGLAEVVNATGIIISVWSYIQIRYRYKQYKMYLANPMMGGRIGEVVALVGLMPSYVTPAFVLIVMVNIATILYRSFLTKGFAFENVAILHDAYLWSSLPLLVMTQVGFLVSLLVVAFAIGCFVFCWERRRLGALQMQV